VRTWLHAHGISIVDGDGMPSLSHRDFERAVVSEGHDADWRTFRGARSLKKSMDKLLELTRAERDGRVYPEVVIRHAVTGRGTVRRPGMQNIARALRPLVVATEGTVLVSLDLNRAEVTIAAAMSGDADLASALEAGDPYLALATQHHGAEAAVGLRDLYKKALIASLYGQGNRSLARALQITEASASELNRGLRESWPQVFAWIEANTAAARRGESGQTITGRPVPLLSPHEAYKRTNHIVQGSGSDLLYRGIERVVALLRDRLQLGPETLVLSVHDEVILEVDARLSEASARVLEEGMTQDLPGGLRLTGEASVLGVAWGK
jgi:DNA polymerase I-like protein with 3'-5' exonuclease and polymerase domains